MSDSDFLRSASAESVMWLVDKVWPLWLTRGIDWKRGGFHEYLTIEDCTCQADYRRLRVATRQIIAFSEAWRFGLARASDAVELGLAFLQRYAIQPDGGYAWRFDLDGHPIDQTRDLYDHAFVLLALSSAAGIHPPGPLRQQALALDAFLQVQFRHPAGGYVESLPPVLPRRQNPHMHLLEAYLAAFATFGDQVFLDRAEALIDLFLRRLIRNPPGALPEYFDDELQPQTVDGRFVTEPGHHAEWIWLLHSYRTASSISAALESPEIADTIALLFEFLDQHGVAANTGALIDEIWSDGTIKSASSRLWPQAERLKAEILRPFCSSEQVYKAFQVLQSYRTRSPQGLWYERRLADDTFTTEPAPASSLYHLVGAITMAHRKITNPEAPR